MNEASEIKKLCFYGESDDLFAFNQGYKGGLQIDCYDKVAVFKVTDTDGHGLFVTGVYAPNPLKVGVWVVGISPLDEDVPLPEWPLSYCMAENGYSPTLVIEAPDGVSVEMVAE